jgi:hypothetical protein
VNAPFVRVSRDRRGYEHFYILQAIPDRRGRMRQRVLYWYRTPPQVRVGREPFDESARRALEAQYPDVPFDWEKIRNTPIPPVEPEYWRERRLAERASRQAAAADDAGRAEASEPSVPPAPAAEGARAPLVESRRARRRRRRGRLAGSAQAIQAGVAAPPSPEDSSPESSLEAGETASAGPEGDSEAAPEDPQSGQ